MSAGAGSYTRLPGRAWSLFGAATLWLAADHVLQVRLRGYTEVYRRFYFRDLQLLALQPSPRGYLGWTVALGLPALLATAAAAAGLAPSWRFWAVLAAIFALPLAVHLARGTTCRCYATTALGTTELVALRRMRAARRSLARIREQVEAVQGTLSQAEQTAPAAAIAMDAGAVPREARHPLPLPMPLPLPPLPPLPAAGPPALPSRRPLRWHRVLVALLAGDAVLTAVQAASELRVFDFLGLVFAVAEVAAALAAIVAQGRSGLGPPALRRFPWAVLAFIGGITLIGWVMAMVWGFRQAAAGIAITTPLLPQPLEALEVAAIFCYLGLALWGWLAVRARRGAQ